MHAGTTLELLTKRSGTHLRAPLALGIPAQLMDRMQYGAVYLGRRRVVHIIQI